MQLIQYLAAAGIVMVALAGSTAPSKAQAYPDYPYCAHYGGERAPGTPVCGYTTREQCLAAVSGTQGYCEFNSWYAPPARHRRTRA